MVDPAARTLPDRGTHVNGVTRTLYIAAALLGILGVGIQFAWPTARGRGEGPAAVPLPAANAPELQPQPGPSTFEDIVALNVFSEARVPPRRRYVPPGSSDSTPRPEARARPRPTAPPYRLFGTIVESDDTTALIDSNPKVPGAELYRVGDRIGRLRIISIREDAVVLDGPGGRRVLRLTTKKGPTP